jgi:hypothetical protein
MSELLQKVSPRRRQSARNIINRKECIFANQDIAASISSMMLTDKKRIHLRFASVRTYTFFTMRFPRFLSIRGLQAFDLPSTK